MKDERLRLLDEVGRSPRTHLFKSRQRVRSRKQYALSLIGLLTSRQNCFALIILPLERLINPMGSVAQTVDEDGDTECEQRIRASRSPDANIAGSSKLAEHCVCASICPHDSSTKRSDVVGQARALWYLDGDYFGRNKPGNDVLKYRFAAAKRGRALLVSKKVFRQRERRGALAGVQDAHGG